MLRVPCPGRPGKWLMLYLKSPVSNAIRERSAAISGGEVTPYFTIALIRNGAACSAVAHSLGNGAPAHVFDVGAIPISCDAADAPAARVVRGKMCGIASAELAVARSTILVA